MFENVINFFKKIGKREQIEEKSKDTAKERLHLVLMQDRANVSADFLDMMKQEIIEVIKKYIDVDEKDIDVRLTNKANEDGTVGAPALYANIPIAGIKEDVKKEKKTKDLDSESIEKNKKVEKDENLKNGKVENLKDEKVEKNESLKDKVNEKVVENKIEKENIKEAEEVVNKDKSEKEKENKKQEEKIEEDIKENEKKVEMQEKKENVVKNNSPKKGNTNKTKKKKS